MKKIKIVLEQAVDMPYDLYRDMEFVVVPMGYQMGEETYLEDMEHSQMSLKEFYDRLKNGEQSKTSQVTIQQFYDTFSNLAQQGYDILHIGIAASLSGTYNSALVAASEVKEKFPDTTIINIDSNSASMGIGVLALEAHRLQQTNTPIEEIAQWLESHKKYVHALFTVDDLNHLKRGGRISATNAAIGSLLSIKPLLTVNQEGVIVPIGKSRGRKSAHKKIVQETLVDPFEPESHICFVGHCDALEDAQHIKELLDAEKVFKEVKIFDIGSVIGSHVGPKTIGILFLGKNRV